MTAHPHFKHLVRARMAATGEPYSTARARVMAAQTEITLTDPVVVDVHGRHGQAVAFTPDGTRVLSGGQDARIAILDAATGSIEGELIGHDKVVNAVVVTPDGRSVISTSSDRTVRIWHLARRSATAVLEGHRDAVIALDVSPDASTAITGGYDGRVRVWAVAEGTCLHEHASSLPRVAAVVWTSDGSRWVEAGQGSVAHVRRSADGALVADLDTGAPAVIGLAMAPDGALLATAGYDGTVLLWACDAWEVVRRLDAGQRANAVAFSRGGHLLAVASRGRIAIWAHDDDEPVAATALPITGVYALAFSPDGRRLAQTGADGKVRIWTLR